MCSVSAVIDQWRDTWTPFVRPNTPPFLPDPIISEGERKKLKKEIEEFRKILEKARKWDAKHPTDPCTETADKVEALREVARALGLEGDVEIVLKEVIENDDMEDKAVYIDGYLVHPHGVVVPGEHQGTVGGVGGVSDSTSG